MTGNSEIGVFPFTLEQRRRFQTGELWQEWTRRYPDIFDDLDRAIAKTQAPKRMGYHFYEWLAAVLIFESMGYLSLVEHYEFKKHKRKQEIVHARVSPELFKLITHHSKDYGRVQCPDLFVYSLETADWFFCEVKGPKDAVRERQRQFFEALETTSGQPIRIIRFKKV
jgi:hypothetical protein